MWIRLDDEIAHHPKFIQVGAVASWLFVGGLAYCARFLTDGLIPFGALPSLTGIPRPERYASALVAAGLWTETDLGWRVHDYHDYQLSRVEVEKRREQRREAGRHGGLRSAEVRSPARSEKEAARLTARFTSRQASCQANDEANAQAEINPIPIPSTSASKNEALVRRAPARGHHGHAFCGQRFCLSHKQLECFQRDLGRLAASSDLLAHCERWDAEAAQSDEPILNVLPWVRERIARDSGAVGRLTAPTEARERWWEECDRLHSPRCANLQWHQVMLAREVKGSA